MLCQSLFDLMITAMQVNKKKSIKLRNRTNYFIPGKDRVSVRFSSPESYQNRQMKIEGYETRLYWQYKYCEAHNGQTFFYTLTYNDYALPRHYGIPCFDYEDLRDLLTGGFRKQLLRKYGTKFKYFISAELGDGKGKRGMHNNPHYHVMFFLEDAKDKRFPYVVISPVEFRHLVRLYWQGFDQDVDGYQDYNTAKYGIAKEGEYTGKVVDFRACSYVCKYVCKDVKLRLHEYKVIRKLRYQFVKEYRNTEESYRDFFKSVIYSMYNSPLNFKKTKWLLSDIELIEKFIPDAFPAVTLFYEKPTTMDGLFYAPFVTDIIKKEHLWDKYSKFVDEHIAPKINEGLNEWRNRFCNKCRVSHGVGDYAMEHIQDKLFPSIQVPSKKGFKNRPISMYYYRKLYCDVVKDSQGHNLYVLNQLGIDYKVANLPDRIQRLINKTSAYLPLILDDEKLYSTMRDSDVNTDVFYSYSELKHYINKILEDDDLTNILKRYAEYKLVYEDRFFSYPAYGMDRSDTVPFVPIDVVSDYSRFLVPSFYSVPRNDLRLTIFLENIPEDYLPYSQHPYFLRYIGIFHVLDLCTDYFFIQSDNKAQSKAEEIQATKRFHSSFGLKAFYSNFKN